jgi:hypothetical protein
MNEAQIIALQGAVSSAPRRDPDESFLANIYTELSDLSGRVDERVNQVLADAGRVAAAIPRGAAAKVGDKMFGVARERLVCRYPDGSVRVASSYGVSTGGGLSLFAPRVLDEVAPMSVPQLLELEALLPEVALELAKVSEIATTLALLGGDKLTSTLTKVRLEAINGGNASDLLSNGIAVGLRNVGSDAEVKVGIPFINRRTYRVGSNETARGLGLVVTRRDGLRRDPLLLGGEAVQQVKDDAPKLARKVGADLKRAQAGPSAAKRAVTRVRNSLSF